MMINRGFNPGKEIMEIGRYVKRHIGNNVRPIGLGSGTFNVLTMIYNYPGSTLDHIAALTAVDKAAVSRMVLSLRKKRLVNAEKDAEDRRAYRLMCSDKGMEAAESLLKIRRRISSNLTEGFTEDEKKQLSDLLDRVKQNIKRVL